MSETVIAEQPRQRWHPFTRTAFRFAFVYLLRHFAVLAQDVNAGRADVDWRFE